MSQLTLFAVKQVPWIENKYAALNSRAVGEKAAEACAKKAERSGFDAEKAGDFILAQLKANGPTPGETLVTDASRAGFICHDQRCWGPVFGRLSRRGLIRTVGFCLRSKGNGTAGGRIWSIA